MITSDIEAMIQVDQNNMKAVERRKLPTWEQLILVTLVNENGISILLATSLFFKAICALIAFSG